MHSLKKFWIFCHYFVHIVSACNVLVWTTFWFYILCVLSSLSVQDKNAGQGIAVEVNGTGGKFWVEKEKKKKILAKNPEKIERFYKVALMLDLIICWALKPKQQYSRQLFLTIVSSISIYKAIKGTLLKFLWSYCRLIDK